MTDLTGRLKDFARRRPQIVCLPDFYIDHFVELPPLPSTIQKLRAIHARGGGGWLGVRQRFLPGGNAGNAARALAVLGAHACLIGRTDEFGARFAEATIGRAGVDLSRLRSDGRLGTTTALEFQPGPRNVMMNHPGSVEGFAPEDLGPEDRALIEGADAVLIGNWAQTGPSGTPLAERVLAWARRGKALTFVDTSDPSDRRRQIPSFLKRVLLSPALDVLGLNEVELRAYAGPGPSLERAARLSRRLHGTLDVHTKAWSATWARGEFAKVPAFRVRCLRATGAGDAWNAGDLAGHLMNLDPKDRLRLANACAAYYLSSPEAAPADSREVARFLRRQ